jgi:hypothetical protein
MSTEAPLKTVLRKMDAHRAACTTSPDLRVQETWDAIEDYLYRLIAAGVMVEKERGE